MILGETQRETVDITYQCLDEEGGLPEFVTVKAWLCEYAGESMSVSLTGYSVWSPGLIIMWEWLSFE